jgi:hypothetical protein
MFLQFVPVVIGAVTIQTRNSLLFSTLDIYMTPQILLQRVRFRTVETRITI